MAAALWLAEGLGGILTGSATDPGTGPLLALLALAFWPAAPAAGPAAPAAAPAAPANMGTVRNGPGTRVHRLSGG